MTREDALQLVKLLSGLESCLLVSKVPVPDHLWEIFEACMTRLEGEVLRGND